MIKENTEPKEEQLVSTTTTPPVTTSSPPSATLTSPISTINHTVQQQRMNNNNHNNNNNNNSYKWKQISLQGLDVSPQLNSLTSPNKISTPPLNSSIQRVSNSCYRLLSFDNFLRLLLRSFLVYSTNSNGSSSKCHEYIDEC